MPKHQQSKFHRFALLAIIGLLLAVPEIIRSFPDFSKSYIWLGVLLMLVLLIVFAGHMVTGVWRGALVNERNRISLSQIQLVLWTVLVLATFLTGAFINLTLVGYDKPPLDIEIPASLWVLMGISTTSLIGSPLLASRKKAQNAPVQEEAQAMNRLVDQGREASTLDTAGRLLANDHPTDALWSDLFEADEVSRAGRLDMSKIQMTFFTLIVALVYGTTLSNEISTLLAKEGFTAFPALHESMVALLGISHAGYLTSKAVPERENI